MDISLIFIGLLDIKLFDTRYDHYAFVLSEIAINQVAILCYRLSVDI
jgi:hypothetical protein